jgi:ribosomal protein S12 methylthiotransferase
VLIDEVEGDSFLARSQHDAPEVDGMVYVNSNKKLKPGDFVKVRITDTLEYDLVGETI